MCLFCGNQDTVWQWHKIFKLQLCSAVLHRAQLNSAQRSAWLSAVRYSVRLTSEFSCTALSHLFVIFYTDSLWLARFCFFLVQTNISMCYTLVVGSRYIFTVLFSCSQQSFPQWSNFFYHVLILYYIILYCVLVYLLILSHSYSSTVLQYVFIIHNPILTDATCLIPFLSDPILSDHILFDPILSDHILSDHILTDPHPLWSHPHWSPSSLIPSSLIPSSLITSSLIISSLIPILSDPILSDPILSDPILSDHILSDHILSVPHPLWSHPLYSYPLGSNPIILTWILSFPFPSPSRLDVENMVLAQPESRENKCEFDQFIVTGGAPIPAICGTNTGAHSNF